MLDDLLAKFSSLDTETSRFGMEDLRESFEDVDRALESVESVLGSLRSWEAPLAAEVASHLVTAGGKRLRPALLFLAYRAGGGEDLSIPKPYAVGCELIHTSTLLHDDVIDEDRERRGVPTANERFGNVNAVLSGDYLVAHVIQQLLSLDRPEPVRHLALVMTQLVQGEILEDELARDPDVTEEQYLRVARLKTATLFSYSAWCGAFLADRDEGDPANFASYAEHLGLAFQMVDDVLDFQSRETGKSPLSDLRKGRVNYPLIIALREEPSLKVKLKKSNFGREFIDENIREINEVVRTTGALAKAREKAREHSSRARACLDGLPENSYRTALEKTSEYVHQRIH